MNKKDIDECSKNHYKCTIVLSFMEQVKHNTPTRKDFEGFLDEEGITDKMNVPEDGQFYMF